MATLKILEIKSEIGAGTRGASLGADAIKLAALQRRDPLFARYSAEEIPDENAVLLQEADYPYARYIDAMVRMYEKIIAKVKQSCADLYYPVLLSGDHATAGATIAGLKAAHPDLRLGTIWVDAHADLHTPLTTPSGNLHGMPLTIALNEDNADCQKHQPQAEALQYWKQLKNAGGSGGKIQPEDIVFIGLRDYEKEEAALIEKYRIPVITVGELRQAGATETAQRTLQLLFACDLIYLSFDVDSLDPDLSVGTGTPVPNGLTEEEAGALLVGLLQDRRVGCFEVTEVNPLLDTENKMANIAFRLLQKVLPVIQQP